MDDWRWLKKYAQDGSETAFAEIIRRHTDLVYSVCLREIGETALAEEATLSVFLVLAHKAATLREEAALASWLFAAARLTSRNVLRRENRRRRREEKAAAEMEQATPTETHRWEEAEPLLNDALSTLSAAQRSLVILRFWEDRPLADIGLSLGISEDAARMRLNRALDRMRRWLSARNVILSAASLAAGLPLAVQPAPARCAEALARLPLPPAVPLDPAFPPSMTAQGVIRTMNAHRLKLQWGAAALIACLSLGTAGAVQVTNQRHAQTVAAEQPHQVTKLAVLAQATDTNAEGVLDRMYATYTAMHSFKCTVRSHEEPLSGDQVATYEIERPNKIRFNRATLIMEPELSGNALAISDGNKLYVTCTENKGLADHYAKISFNPVVGEHEDLFAAFGGLGGWGSEPFAGMPNAALGIKLKPTFSMADPKYLLGKPTVIDFPGWPGPMPLDVVVVRIPYKPDTPGRDWEGASQRITYYVGQKDHLLYQVVVSNPISPTEWSTRTETYTSIEVNPNIPASDFMFTPPPGSHEVGRVEDLFPGGKM